MSSLPPAGKRPRTDLDPTDTLGIGKQFGKGHRERRRGLADRRHIQTDRRIATGDRRVVPAEVQTTGVVEPVHLEDDQQRIQPNPKAPVTGVSDAERMSNAVTTGVPVGSAEMGSRGVPASGVAVINHVQPTNSPETSGKVMDSVGRVGESDLKGSGFNSQFAQRSRGSGNRRFFQRRSGAALPEGQQERRKITDRRVSSG